MGGIRRHGPLLQYPNRIMYNSFSFKHQGYSEIIQNRYFAIFPVYATILGQFTSGFHFSKQYKGNRSLHVYYDSVNTGTSENIWSNSSIQMWSTSKDWKTGYFIKTGATEKFL